MKHPLPIAPCNYVLTNNCHILYKEKARMIQKQISLPEDLDQQIQERAKRLHASEERVIQQLIEEGLKSATTRADRFSVLDSIRTKNTDVDPDEVLRDVTQAVEAVRQELYDKAKADQGRH